MLQFTGPAPTNLLIVSLDTTRRAPNLDAVLAQSVVLENHRSCSSWTAPSMTCVTTGLTPFELGWWPWSPDPAVPGFDVDLPTLAVQLKFLNGLATRLVTSNTVFDSGLNFDQGFDTVIRPSWLPAENVTNAALDQAGQLVGGPDPFYPHVHYIDPHGSYCPPAAYVDTGDDAPMGDHDICLEMYSMAWYLWPWAGAVWQARFERNLQELYDAEVEYWDVEFGRLWTELDAIGAGRHARGVRDRPRRAAVRARLAGARGHARRRGDPVHAAFWARNRADRRLRPAGSARHRPVGPMQAFVDEVLLAWPTSAPAALAPA